MPQRHKETRDIKDVQELSTSECHNHVNRIFLTFGFLARNKFGNATTPQGIAHYLRLARVGKQVEFQCHKLLKRISLTFGFLQKVNLTMPQRHTETRDIKDLQKLSTSECHKHVNRIFLTFGPLARNKLGNATTPQGITRYLRLVRVGNQLKFQCHKLMKRIFPNFRLLAKTKFGKATTPQRNA